MNRNRKAFGRRGRRGVILIVCLWLLAALSLLVLGLAYRLRLESKMVLYRLHREEMLELARAASAVALARIEDSPREITSFSQPWARPISLTGDSFGDLEAEKLERYEVAAYVYDELGRININAAYRAQLGSLPEIGEEAISAIVDWRDRDDEPSHLGAESSYYRTLDPPYMPKSAPLDSVYELLSVKGITEEMFYGPDGRVVKIPDGTAEWTPAAEGMRDWLTACGDGTVNLNTASFTVLATLPGMSPEIADSVLYARRGPDGIERTEDDFAFEDFEQLREVGGMTEFARLQLAARCRLNSSFFEIRAQVTDRMTSSKLHLDAVVELAGRGIRIISWRER